MLLDKVRDCHSVNESVQCRLTTVSGPILEKIGESDKHIIINDFVLSFISLLGDSRLGRKLH